MKRFLIAAGAALAATPALAHHPLGGLPMTTFSEGLLSGVGHPVLGFDHLFFVALMGIAAIYTGQALRAPLAYVGAMLAGCALMAAGVALPMAETVIVASLLVLGFLVASGRALSPTMAIALFAGFGLFHGSAFGGTIAGQEGGVGGAVFAGYLIGLAMIQYAIAIVAGFTMRRVLAAPGAASINARLAGAMVAGVGIFLSLEILEGPIVAALAG
ncbi:urease accessory protein [Jannaschia faecimaris]|uniref:Urease accessory protein n=1 Tax=Jannaschia faecimaris TaxID=1244108 RepID=A0A1H3LDJ5_9RHOB|nr:HupE/UreJ family protein [Jannaschia faecimaris]SDY62386.1 urease accessory protein [Jannaschia faecimaris]